MSFVALLSCVLFQHVDNDIVYATVGGKKLTLDAYRPPIPNTKVFIAIHGAPASGGKKGAETGELCRYLSKRGFTCFDIEYRQPKDVGGDPSKALEAATADTITAFHWVEQNAKTYGGNSSRIAIGGISAGATTALTSAYSRGLPVRGVVDLWGGLYGKQSDIKSGGPPLLIIHGINDKVVSIGIARAIENRARAVGIRVKFISHNGGHGIDLTKELSRATILEHVESFLHDVMREHS